jgi:hypothetical protein
MNNFSTRYSYNKTKFNFSLQDSIKWVNILGLWVTIKFILVENYIRAVE